MLLESSDEDTLLKVSDFGLSKFVHKDSVMRTLCGTPLYVAPEVLITGGRASYTQKVDIWSLGVVLYTWLADAIFKQLVLVLNKFSLGFQLEWNIALLG